MIYSCFEWCSVKYVFCFLTPKSRAIFRQFVDNLVLLKFLSYRQVRYEWVSKHCKRYVICLSSVLRIFHDIFKISRFSLYWTLHVTITQEKYISQYLWNRRFYFVSSKNSNLKNASRQFSACLCLWWLIPCRCTKYWCDEKPRLFYDLFH